MQWSSVHIVHMGVCDFHMGERGFQAGGGIRRAFWGRREMDRIGAGAGETVVVAHGNYGLRPPRAPRANVAEHTGERVHGNDRVGVPRNAGRAEYNRMGLARSIMGRARSVISAAAARPSVHGYDRPGAVILSHGTNKHARNETLNAVLVQTSENGCGLGD